MNKRSEGIALVTVLSLTIVLMTIVGLLTAVTVSDLTQARSSIQQMQARAVAEAGEVYARYAAGTAAQPDIRQLLRGYMRTNVNPAQEWAIASSNWTTVQGLLQDLLNTNYGVLSESELAGIGSASISYTLRNFRGGTQSSSSQTYVVEYVVTSTGNASTAVRRIEDIGILEIQLGRPSLSQYLFLVDDGRGDEAYYATGSRFNGPAHANRDWGFGGAPEFLDTATTSSSGAYYWNPSGSCGSQSVTYVQGDSRPPCTVPVFAKGFTRNAPEIDLPVSSLSQQRAALGLDPESTGNVANRDLCRILRGASASCNGSNPSIPNGVYVVNDGSQITGGIYVRGNVDELLLDASGRDGIQTYEFLQGTTRTTIELNFAANQTTITVVSGSGAPQVSVLDGVPNGPAPVGTGGPTGQVYVEGTILGLTSLERSGSIGSNFQEHPIPSQIRPALARETQLNITAGGRIDVWSDIVYECDPTQVAEPSYIAQYPRCDTGGQVLPTVLGVMSLRDDIQVTTRTPDNVFLWGSYLSGATGRGLSVENHTSRPNQGLLHIFGGLIQSANQPRGTARGTTQVSGYRSTYDYDLRFANGALAPPNFPTVRVFDVQNVIPVKLGFREY